MIDENSPDHKKYKIGRHYDEWVKVYRIDEKLASFLYFGIAIGALAEQLVVAYFPGSRGWIFQAGVIVFGLVMGLVYRQKSKNIGDEARADRNRYLKSV